MKRRNYFALNLLVIAVISAFTGAMFYGITYKIKVGYIEIQSRQIEILNDQIQVVVDDMMETIENEPRWRLSYQWEEKYKKEAWQTFSDSRILFNGYKDTVRCTVDEQYSEGIRMVIETYPIVWREQTSKITLIYGLDYKLIDKECLFLTQDQYFRKALKAIQTDAVIVACATAIVLTAINISTISIIIIRKNKS